MFFSNGYILLAPSYSTKTYLLDDNGRVVHRWRSKHIQSLGVHLLEDGCLLRSCSPDPGRNFFTRGHTGRIEKFDCNGTLIWEFEYRSDRYRLHNDIEPLPNGNIIMISWMFMSEEEAISAGCNPKLVHQGEFWSDHIIEVEPTGSSGGNIVWEWHVWDHLIQDYDSTKDNYGVVGDHPELIDINCEVSHPGLGRIFPNLASSDFVHLNSLDYNEEFDQILVGARNLNEIWVIDHSTTIEEAAGHSGGNSGKGGDLLYRWGNPENYRAGNDNDQQLYVQHDARWVETGCPGEGHITYFNNGLGRPGVDYSSVEEIVPPVDSNGNYFLEPGYKYGPEKPIWKYTHNHPLLFYSPFVSGAQRLSNGNTLICSGWRKFYFLEVTPDKDVVWRYYKLRMFPFVNNVFTIQYYPSDYPGIKNIEKFNFELLQN